MRASRRAGVRRRRSDQDALPRSARPAGRRSALCQDVRFAFRVLLRRLAASRSPRSSCSALGIGVNNMFFTLVYAHKFRGVPIADGRSGAVHLDLRRSHQPQLVSLPEYSLTSRRGTPASAAWPRTSTASRPSGMKAALRTGSTRPISPRMRCHCSVSRSLGRLPSAGDDRPGGAAVALLGSDAWRHATPATRRSWAAPCPSTGRRSPWWASFPSNPASRARRASGCRLGSFRTGRRIVRPGRCTSSAGCGMG